MNSEGYAMIKSINYTVLLSILLFFTYSAVQGGWADRPKEGTQVVEKSKFLIDEGQKMVDDKCQDIVDTFKCQYIEDSSINKM
jgi:hypothetical protein